ncbi:MAG: 7-cyano-7-deazaguanine synthase QueC [Buchnera aphidicola (Brevicoryne brassicae)]|uniref:7-cyano-7-deazaguanine synthase n=1 Tax=Buchnera aphidicola (Brevicoryne brassicae) TaxID=911343 RepID=A0AAJ5PVG8_9GAMM|nr:7-cyano-7-deazaguanine synthase QueC [Buchnera aphidicola]QCI20153.1 7-cyano-7-deazaguanine synthase QueC [Buchnera aphidicola (Brevicoryne brassicae)]WAI19245.1 MAG: 7-cyano-7-deazaguanine synthase QueC [Buchnera aphidicola (Brevicoryne brassicae)]
MKKALVILSGGQDSTTCLAYYTHVYKEIHCITFDYNQLHKSEINSAILISKKLGIKNHIILDVQYLQKISFSSLTNKNISIHRNHPLDNLFPSTFVPGRNILFLTLSSIYAYSNKISSVILGVNEIDFSGYPDCRNEFIKNMNYVIQIGMNCNISFITPLMNLNKPEIWALSDYCNITDIILNDTVTCYNGIKGIGCSECKSCTIRKKGFDEWKSNRSYYMNSMKTKMKLL